MEQLVALSANPTASLTLAREAALALSEPGADLEKRARVLQREITAGRAQGGLWVRDGRPVGIALWEPAGPLGVAVRVSYLAPGAVSVDRYRELLLATERSAGKLAFAASMPGLAPDDEQTTMRSLGFAPFVRWEMRYPPAAAVPLVGTVDGVTLRPVCPGDEPELVRVHAAAYRDHFDRFLFLEDLDPTRDAEGLMRSLFRGRWGELLFGPSTVAEAESHLVGETMVIRSDNRALIADVAVDPAHGGRGIGRALMAATLRALREAGETTIALAVTEGNRRAVQLYERVGFVRTLGPSREWYNTRLISNPPADD